MTRPEGSNRVDPFEQAEKGAAVTVSIDRSIISGVGRSLVLVLGAAFIASCSAATSSPGESAPAASAPATTPPVVAPVVSASASSGDIAASSAPETPGPTAVATELDPCQLVTPAEASKLAGASFTAGTESTTEGHGKICTYGQEGTVFQVIVGVAPDEATAKAGEQDAIGLLQKAASNGLKVTQLPGFADGTDAATLTGSKTFAGQTVAATAIYLLKGTTFVGISDIATLGAKAPTEQQMKDQAKVTLTRLP
jgi:hypothetical protein